MIVLGENLTIKRHVTSARAGVIPYTIHNERLFFLMGVDRRYGDFTDFGGGVKRTESLLDGAYREFTEESCKMFAGTVSKQTLLSSQAITDRFRTVAIFFVYVPPEWLSTAPKRFEECHEELQHIKKHNELSEVYWLEQQPFRSQVFGDTPSRVWEKTRTTIRSGSTWENLQMVLG